MAVRPIQPEELQKAIELYCVGSGVTASEGEDHGQKRYLLSPGDIVVRLEDGRIITDSQSTYEKLCEILMDLRQTEPVNAPKRPHLRRPRQIPHRPKKARFGALVKPPQPARDVQVSELTLNDIKDFICPEATDQEAYIKVGRS